MNRIVSRFTEPEPEEVFKGQNESARILKSMYGGSNFRARFKGSLDSNEELKIWTGTEAVENTRANRKAHPFGRSNQALVTGRPSPGDRLVGQRRY